MNITEKSDNKRLASNTIILYLRTFFVLIISLYASRVILQTLGVVDFGIYNVVAGLVSMFELMQISLTSAVQRYYNYENAKEGGAGLKLVYSTTLLIQLTISIILILLVETLGQWYLLNKMVIPDDRMAAAIFLFHISCVLLFIRVVQVPYISLVISKEKMTVFAIYGIVEIFLKLLFILSIPYFPGDRLEIYALLLLCLNVISLIFYYLYCKIKFNDIIRISRPSKELFFEMFKFICWSATSGFSNIIQNQGVNMLLNFFFGPVVNAARGISYQIKAALVGFISNISMAARPQLVESYTKGDYNRSKNIMYLISRASFLAIYIFTIPIIIERKLILEVWLGDYVPEHTETFMVWILLMTIVDILCTPLNMIIYAKGDIAAYNIIYSITGLLIIPSAIVTFHYFKIPELVYIENFVFCIFCFLISVYFAYKKAGVSVLDYSANVLLPILKVIVISLLLIFLSEVTVCGKWVHFLLFFPTSFLILLLSSFIFGLNPNERVAVQNLLVKKNHL